MFWVGKRSIALPRPRKGFWHAGNCQSRNCETAGLPPAILQSALCSLAATNQTSGPLTHLLPQQVSHWTAPHAPTLESLSDRP